LRLNIRHLLNLRRSYTNAHNRKGELTEFSLPEKATLNLILDGTEYENSYSLWIYPANGEIKVPEGITIAEKLDNRTLENLAAGCKLLLFPDHNDIRVQ